MQKRVIVTFIDAVKKGVSKKTGEPYALTNIDVEWTVEQPGVEPYTQSCNGTVRGWINRDMLSEACQKKKPILVTMYVSVRTWENRHFTQVDIYLPKEYMLEAEPI